MKILEKSGFKVIRQKGSPVIMMNDKGTRIVVPVHLGKDVKPGLIRAIIKGSMIKQRKILQTSRRNLTLSPLLC
ncbi:MAG: type II toxin-antitoxin system HicA family toxin [Candidatus Bathyarchaeia archaeon]|nr:type II toxin-antitoxin system HicA family toxin [Candidatus Bathyarchaeia archaeon]